MREMHKWKDKVELSLDNRQLFFLFFGLSVIGCFVFALGIMTGRRLQWEPGQEAAALGGDSSLALLDGEPPEERFAFRSGLAESDAEALPPTRDPGLPPRDEDEVRAERVEQAEAAQLEASLASQQALAQVAPQAVAKPEAAKPEAKPEAGQPKPSAGESADGRRFTLQMKAFSRQEDAAKLVDRLKHNGHEARIESHEVRGRAWHRVRIGEFDQWEEALAAKQAFEKSEHIIAYVVSL
jgi:cell division septation protein DedD